MWLFRKKDEKKTIFAEVLRLDDGRVSIDVRGQTCPGYLLSINNAMDALDVGTSAVLVTTYAPCGDDVKAWCKEKGYTFKGMRQDGDAWTISVVK
ncbi:sulfurtransferase TusA family protein [Ectothiorhodospiraceae bacterium 2226]|nr:sulfurtransferase TusA family protein [Ectothiorhodospiraceae bacterium 2226]